MKGTGMKVLFAASEMMPYAHTGGLGDVIGSLPHALAGLGVEVAVALPFFRKVQALDLGLVESVSRHLVQLGQRIEGFRVLSHENNGVRVFFVDKPEYFDRDGFYLDANGHDFPDNAERFIFFNRAVLELALSMQERPRIIHCHDWQAGLIPACLATLHGEDQRFAETATVFTIHNIGYQGLFPGAASMPLTGLDWSLYTPDGLEYYDNINMLKAGIVFSDALTTVSEKYAEEIQTPEYGLGMDGIIRAHKDKLTGILNGVDYKRWDPATDRFLPRNYGPDDPSGKRECKEALVRELGLKSGADIPLLGMVTRLAGQKGIDILIQAMDEIMSLDVNLVLLGVGSRELEERMQELDRKFEGRLSAGIRFDERLSHLIEAGSDFFLMPSRYEPSGLNQIYSLKYGTIPIVRATGGLDDTIVDVEQYPASGNGFKFSEYTPQALAACVARAVQYYRERPDDWKALMGRAFREDFSWKRSAGRYVETYRRALARRTGRAES